MDEVFRTAVLCRAPPPSLMHPGPGAETPPPRGPVTGWLMSCSVHAPQTGPTFSPNEPPSPPWSYLY
jgi:hypothetical protein